MRPGNSVFNILRNCLAVLHSYQQDTRVPVSALPCQHLLFSGLGLVLGFDSIHSDRYEVVTHRGCDLKGVAVLVLTLVAAPTLSPLRCPLGRITTKACHSVPQLPSLPPAVLSPRSRWSDPVTKNSNNKPNRISLFSDLCPCVPSLLPISSTALLLCLAPAIVHVILPSWRLSFLIFLGFVLKCHLSEAFPDLPAYPLLCPRWH